MKKCIQTTIVLFVLVLFAPAAQAASDVIPEINLPSNVKIEKDSDVTAAMFSRLLGQSWHEIAGEKSDATDTGVYPGGLGFFSGLIVAVLGTLNLAAMAFVASSIIYMWGIFAVTTAHEGKSIGGSIYNSLWVPVRHAASFSLTVPVLNGLSLLQVVIIASVSLSINFANTIWDTAGEYIAEHAHVGIIDSASPMLETEAYTMIPIFFEDMVVQEIEIGRERYSNSDVWWNTDVEYNMAGMRSSGTAKEVLYTVPVNAAGETDQNGAYIMQIDNAQGALRIYARPPKGLALSAMGGVSIPYPKFVQTLQSDDADYENSIPTMVFMMPTDPDQLATWRVGVHIASNRAVAFLSMWEQMRNHAKVYLNSNASVGTSCLVPIDDKCGNLQLDTVPIADLVDKYRKFAAQSSAAAVQQYVQSDELKRRQFAQALDNIDGKSRYGWASAGMFSFTLASLQKKVDDEIMKTISPIYRQLYARNEESGLFGWDWTKTPFAVKLKPEERLSLQRASGYVARTLLHNTRYAATENANEAEGGSDTLRRIGSTVLQAVVISKSVHDDGKRNKGGLLSMVLDEFGTYDPIVVMQAFGDRMINAGEKSMAVIGIATAFSGKFVGISLILMIFFVGGLFAYVVPITPFIFWLRALLSWIFMVVESMAAAPFWACAHALPEGAGFAGQHARKGWVMLLDIIVRPTLLVLGAVFAIAIIQATGWLFNVLLNAWFANVSGAFISMGLLSDIVFSIMVMSTMYYASITIYTKGIMHLPENVIKWIGGQGTSLGEEQDTQKSVQALGIVMGNSQGATPRGNIPGKNMLDKLKGKGQGEDGTKVPGPGSLPGQIASKDE